MYEIILAILWQSWLVLGEMAPYLLLGFVIAGLLALWISPAWVERHLGGQGLLPVLKAALLGVPLPLCSCSVIPVAASVRRHGASRAATTAFLLSTPETGVDSIAVTYALLGPVFAVFRPIAALVSGVLGGALVLLLGERNHEGPAGTPDATPCNEPCCAGGRTQNRLIAALHYGLITLPRDLALPLLAGVLVAGVLAALVPQDAWRAYLGGGIVSILLMMALGIPIYVCATASVPIAVGLLHSGASPGAVLAFLMAGPATNAATLVSVWKVLGRRTALLYLTAIAISAVACGLLLDQLFVATQLLVPRLAAQVTETAEGGWVTSLWAAILLGLLAFSFLVSRQRPKGRPKEDSHPAAANACAEHACCHGACGEEHH